VPRVHSPVGVAGGIKSESFVGRVGCVAERLRGDAPLVEVHFAVTSSSPAGS
jgi:hypothetical protein